MNQDFKELIEVAQESKKNAYVPYSGFKVGAAVMTGDGKIYGGCNVENASYGATNCAERTAVFKAVSEGHTDIKAIAISGDTKEHLYPCGICRQVLIEFGDDIIIVLMNKNGEAKLTTIGKLLPNSFTNKDMEEVQDGI
ncbi:cytidine deaminase [Alkalibacter sp. M17DMB]|nr:cytidine deaminase [Alkalibacter mobilis]